VMAARRRRPAGGGASAPLGYTRDDSARRQEIDVASTLMAKVGPDRRALTPLAAEAEDRLGRVLDLVARAHDRYRVPGD